MANITVSPTRMELTRLKGKLKTAQRGHKLLKDKRDELMKQFLDTVREVRSLRAEVEEDLMAVHKSFTVASALMSSEALEQALLYPKQSVELTRTTQNIMSVNVPVYDFQTKTKSDSDIYPYGFAATSGELDDAVEALGLVFRKMLKLAQIEKSAQLMAEEIEKTRRRVNALEYVMIPNTQEAIRYITMKLDENDRAVYKRQAKSRTQGNENADRRPTRRILPRGQRQRRVRALLPRPCHGPTAVSYTHLFQGKIAVFQVMVAHHRVIPRSFNAKYSHIASILSAGQSTLSLIHICVLSETQ